MTKKKQGTRRDFLQHLAAATGSIVLMPLVSACTSAPEPKMGADSMPMEKASSMAADKMGGMPKSMPSSMEMTKALVPKSQPEGWDPIAYNKIRGNAGAIPKTYHASINGPDGDNKHLGKHLPYQPTLDAAMVPAGYVAIMWGDPSKGHAKHPNAPKSDGNPAGHWYNSIKIRKATDGEAEEVMSEYVSWPGTDGGTEKYAVLGGGDITSEKGKNTIYMAALPKDVKKGDTLRIYAHCLTHGEYVDFMTL